MPSTGTGSQLPAEINQPLLDTDDEEKRKKGKEEMKELYGETYDEDEEQ